MCKCYKGHVAYYQIVIKLKHKAYRTDNIHHVISFCRFHWDYCIQLRNQPVALNKQKQKQETYSYEKITHKCNLKESECFIQNCFSLQMQSRKYLSFYVILQNLYSKRTTWQFIFQHLSASLLLRWSKERNESTSTNKRTEWRKDRKIPSINWVLTIPCWAIWSRSGILMGFKHHTANVYTNLIWFGG